MPYTAQSYNVDLLQEENVKKFILPHYGLENASISQIKFKDSDKQRAVYKIEAKEQCYCLKKVYFQKPDLLFVYSAIEWLHQYGILVPTILPTKDNGRFVEYKGMLFILTPWIEGIKCDYDNLEHVFAASSNLANMHNATKRFEPILGSKLREGKDNLAASTEKHFQQLLLCSNLAYKYDDKFSKLFLDYFDINYQLAELSTKVAHSIKAEYIGTALCHLDYVNKNLIFNYNNNLWVIDFDKCRIDFCTHDISYFLRRLLKRENTKWDLEIASKCLKIYEEIHPLNFQEYKYIFVSLVFPQKFWKISRDYFNNIKKCNINSFYILLQKAVEKSQNQLQFAMEFKKFIEEKFQNNL